MVCLAPCRQELQQKSWKTARLFLQDRDYDQMFKTKTKTFIFVVEEPRDQDGKTLISRTTSLYVIPFTSPEMTWWWKSVISTLESMAIYQRNMDDTENITSQLDFDFMISNFVFVFIDCTALTLALT